MLCQIYSLQSLYRHQQAPTIAPPHTNQNMHNLYAIRQQQQQQQHHQHQHQQQQIDAAYENTIPKIKQSQKITKNVHVAPLVSLIIPEHSYQLNSDISKNEVGAKDGICQKRKIEKCNKSMLKFV